MRRPLYIGTLAAAALLIIAIMAVALESIAPGDFPLNTVVKIPVGATLSQSAALLHDDGLIRSEFMYKIYATLLGGTSGVKSGAYLFVSPQSALKVASRVVHGDSGIPPIKVFIFEGADTADMAKSLAKAIPGFSAKDFLVLAKPHEGYLFPDTYYFTADDTPASVVKVMLTAFDGKTAPLAGQIASSHRTLSDIVNMASIVEKEATSSADRRMIAGILWKRLGAGMALQVDPPFYYILDTTSALTLDDLRTVSPYNLYQNKGLPPTPIDSPGLAAIEDTLAPMASPYWFYLSGRDGRMHFATTLDGHIANIQKYLN